MEEINNFKYELLKKNLLNFINNLNLNYTIIINEHYQGANFASFGHDGVITLNAIPLVKRACEKSWSIQDTFLLALCHEIGHAQDPDYHTLYSQINSKFNEFEAFRKHLAKFKKFDQKDFDELNDILDEYSDLTQKMESNAMNIGKKFIPTHLKNYYEEDNYDNLRLYLHKVMDFRRVDKVFYELRDKGVDLGEAIRQYDEKLKAVNEIRKQ
ncbi:hypothetical protein [Priestia megaterium]|uniref:hypothetical protein n=1 Tax=Priestia megaterium TaxID=1404 RepID=UPI00300A2DBC